MSDERAVSMSDFSGKTVLVTGASRGVGRAIAIGFAERGAFVAVGYHTREEEASLTLQTLREHGGDGALCGFDVGQPEAVRAAIEQLSSEHAGLHVLVNCAGVARDNLFAMMSGEDWQEPIQVNLNGAFYCCRAAVPRMIAQRRGAIVNVASVSGMTASPGQAGYSASKGGVLALTRTLGAELARYGVRVNAVVPGLLSTGMAARLDRRVLLDKQQKIPLGRLGTGEEVANVVLFLASEAAAYIVGQAIVVDGGLSL